MNLAPDFQPSTTVEYETKPMQCGICTQHFGVPLVTKREIPCCPTCGDLLDEAVDSDSVIVRKLCAPWTTEGAPTCGRVWGVFLMAGLASGGLVQDSHTVCPRCRPQQSADVDRVLGTFEEGSA